MKVIVNGDDLGLSKDVNDRTLDLMTQGLITSVTLLANAPEIEDAVQRIPASVNCSFGVHLNLTEFSPLTPKKKWEDLREVITSSGKFAGENVLRNVPITAGMKNAFLNEWRLQVRKLLTMGIEISHFDSHNHIHTMPSLFFVLKQLQEEFKICKVRTTWNLYPRCAPPGWKVALKKRLWSMALQSYYPTRTTSVFTSLAVFYEWAKAESLKAKSVEVMVHPGHPHFEEETRLLEKDWRRELIFKTELTTYRDL